MTVSFGRSAKKVTASGERKGNENVKYYSLATGQIFDPY